MHWFSQCLRLMFLPDGHWFSARQTPPRSGCVCSEGSAAWSLKLCNKLQYHYCRFMKGCVFVVKKFTISFFWFFLLSFLLLSVPLTEPSPSWCLQNGCVLVVLLFPKGLIWITLYIYDECKPLRNCCYTLAFVCICFHFGKGTNSAQGSTDTKFDWLYKMSKDSLIQTFFLWHSFVFSFFFKYRYKYWNHFW